MAESSAGNAGSQDVPVSTTTSDHTHSSHSNSDVTNRPPSPQQPSLSLTQAALSVLPIPRFPLTYISYAASFLPPAVADTLLPQPIAQLVSSLAMGSRISIRGIAFFLEAMIEGSRYSTQLGLGITRRTLITAITAARRSYEITHSAQQRLGYGNPASNSDEDNSNGKTAFVDVLDRYTNLGVYFLHHTFSLAELVALSSLSLLSTTVQTTHRVAEETVGLFDGIFGSSETSRMVSAIISMLSRELGAGERDSQESGSAGWASLGRTKALAMLTKAMCAFAILQHETRERRRAQFGLEVLADCVVVKGEKSGSFESPSTPQKALPQLPGNESSRPQARVTSPSRSSSQASMQRPTASDRPS